MSVVCHCFAGIFLLFAVMHVIAVSCKRCIGFNCCSKLPLRPLPDTQPYQEKHGEDIWDYVRMTGHIHKHILEDSLQWTTCLLSLSQFQAVAELRRKVEVPDIQWRRRGRNKTADRLTHEARTQRSTDDSVSIKQEERCWIFGLQCMHDVASNSIWWNIFVWHLLLCNHCNTILSFSRGTFANRLDGAEVDGHVMKENLPH